MSDDNGGGVSSARQADDFADQVNDRGLIDRLVPVALALAAHVGRDGRGVPPLRPSFVKLRRIPGFGKLATTVPTAPSLSGDVDADAFLSITRCVLFAHVCIRSSCLRRLRMKDGQHGASPRRQYRSISIA